MKYITRTEFENRLDKTDNKIDSLIDKMDEYSECTKNSLFDLRSDLNGIRDPIIEIENGSPSKILQSELLKMMYKGIYSLILFTNVMNWVWRKKFLFLILIAIILFAFGLINFNDFGRIILGS